MKLLTGKCKEEFEKWLRQWIIHNTELHKEPERIQGHVDEFHLNPFSMQWGVYLEFFDSKGWIIEIHKKARCSSQTGWYIEFVPMVGFMYSEDTTIIHPAKTRQQALIEAIKKANEIFNQ